MVNIWWCNQGGCWKCERRNNVVCSSNLGTHLKYRRMAGDVKKDDLIVHYVKTKKHIVAISRAKEDGYEKQNISFDNCECEYGGAWTFKTEYYDLKRPIDRDSVNKQIFDLNLVDSPIVSGLKVRRAYFMPFSKEGLNIIKSVTNEIFPDWI